jgi:hypothetical protein
MTGTAQKVSSLLPPGEGQDEGMIHKRPSPYGPLTLTLSRRERENNVDYLLVGSVTMSLRIHWRRAICLAASLHVPVGFNGIEPR